MNGGLGIMSFKHKTQHMYDITTPNIKPLEHFADDDWSIQTERTHGIKGLVKVTKAHMENPKLALKQKSGLRMVGAEDMFRGTKEAVRNYILKEYPGTTRVDFI